MQKDFIELKKHQVRAIEDVFIHPFGLINNDRTQLIKACGTGKTITGLFILERYLKEFNKKTSINILLFPSLYLVNQTYEEYMKYCTIENYNPLVICSDKKVGLKDEVFEIDSTGVNYPVTTTIKEICEYLEDDSIDHKVIFITYHSSHLLGKSLVKLGLKASLSIFDEAHKVATKNNLKRDSMSITLDNDLFPCEKRLFMTATPKHIFFKADAFEEDKDIIAFSMDNKKQFGKISHEYSMRQAIQDGVITDYQILGILIDKEYVERFRCVDGNKAYKDKQEVVNEEDIKSAKFKAVEATMKKYNIKRSLAFHATIEESKEFAKMSIDKNYTDLTISHIDSKSSHSQKEKIIKDLKSKENYVVSNSRLLTEGVDVPSVDLISIMKNMSSRTDIIQTIGRVQRVDKNNPDKIGYILLPIFIEDINISKDEIKTNRDLENLFDILNSLKENDKQLRNLLAVKKRDLQLSSDTKELYKIAHIEEINDEFINERYKQKLKQFHDNVEGVILNSRIFTKEDYVNATLDFIDKFGYESLKKDTIHNSLNIYSFRQINRKKFQGLKSQEERQSMIDEFSVIHPDFLFITSDTVKRKHIEATLDFIEKFGWEKLKVKTNYKGFEIGCFMSRQRMRFKGLETQKERQSMIDEFSVIHPDYLLESIEVTKREHINATLDFIDKFGWEALKSTTIHRGLKIGQWRTNKKRYYRRASTEEKKVMIDEFSVIHPDYLLESIEVTKREHINATLDFIDKYGYDNFKQNTKHNDLKIGIYRTSQKTKFKKLKTDKERQSMIDEFSFIHPDYLFNEHELLKKENINATLDFIDKFGYESLKQDTIHNNANIGYFRYKNRKEYNNLRNNEEREDMIKEFSMFPDDYLGKKAFEFINKKE